MTSIKDSKPYWHQTTKVIDTSKENLYRVPSVQDSSEASFQILGPSPIAQKGKLKMAGSIKGGEPTKKPKKKAAKKKAAKKKAAKKK